VEGVGWLEAWGPSLIAAMEQLQKMAEARLAARQSAPCRGEQNGG
jgi:hypothetical protein